MQNDASSVSNAKADSCSCVCSPSHKSALQFELTEKQLSEMKQAFDLFDFGRTGFIHATAVKYVVRRLGYKVNENHLKDLLPETKNHGMRLVSFDYFQRLMAIVILKHDATLEMIKGVVDFCSDNITSRISIQKMKSMAHELGQRLTDEELEEIVNFADLDTEEFSLA